MEQNASSIQVRVVIPYRREPNNDLLYAIKSIEKNYELLQDIIIVGDDPPFKFDGWVIHCHDGHDKESNIFKKLKRVPGEVLFTNDDIFFMQPVREVPNFYRGLCSDRNNESPYYRNMYNRCPPGWLDFDVHCPMVINTDIFKWVGQMPMKSQYGNTCTDIQQAVLVKDFKIKTLEEFDRARQFLSISNQLSRYVEPILRDIFT